MRTEKIVLNDSRYLIRVSSFKPVFHAVEMSIKLTRKKKRHLFEKNLYENPQGMTIATTRENKYSRFPGRRKTGYLGNY